MVDYCLPHMASKNSRIHRGEIKIEERIIKNIKKDVKFRMMFKGVGITQS